MRHGFVLIDKLKGPTSHDVVGMVRRLLSEPHIGHLGTLDPMASGLLVLAVGSKALKVVELFMRLPKEYDAEIHLGAVSTTYDGEGVITENVAKIGWTPPVDWAVIQALIDDRFLGRIRQVPPAHSAINIGGERAYRKARNNQQLELAAREVLISKCTVTGYAYPKLRLSVACGSGTYIRSLASDLGESMRCGGYLSALRRTKVGDWRVTNAVKPDQVGWTNVLPLKDILKDFPGIEVGSAAWDDLQHGRSIPGTMKGSELVAWHADLPVALLEKDPKREGKVKPRKVL